MTGWLNGLLFGLLLSLMDAIISKARLPIMTFGAANGVVNGFVVGMGGQ